MSNASSPYLNNEPRSLCATVADMRGEIEDAVVRLAILKGTTQALLIESRKLVNHTRGLLSGAVESAEESLARALEDIEAAIGVAEDERRDLETIGGCA